MEMRLLNTDGERNIFAQRLADARAGHGATYRDAGESHARNMVRLAAADIYGLFETECGLAERMIAGAALHNLAAYPQSCEQPDLSGYASQSVLECSDHWSLSRGAGMCAWRGIAVQVVHRNPRAVLVYLAVRGSAHYGFYAAMGFVNVGTPVEYPYLEESDQGRPWVQPMILEGEALAKLTSNVRRLKIETPDDYLTIRFDNSDRLRPATNRYPLRIGEMAAGAAQA
jgi:hypothetical protein